MRTLWSLIWLVVLALGSNGTVAIAESTVASVPFTFDYDGQTQATTHYDGLSVPVTGYDGTGEHAADERGNATTGNRVLFGRFGVFLAAKTPALLNPPIKITEKGLQHVVERHTVNDLAKFASKSKFNAGEDLTALIQRGTQQPMVPQGNRFIRTFDAGRNIGLDRATGQQTSIMTIVTEADGTLVTAFPGVP